MSDALLRIEARAIAEQLGVATAPQPSVDRVAERLIRIRREATDQAYAEGREDRDRLRSERNSAENYLADLLRAVDVILRRPGAPTDALRDTAGAARAYLDRGRA